MLMIAHADLYAHPLPPGHRFPMVKYELIPEQLRYEGTATADNFFVPIPLAEEDILPVHDTDYWRRLKYLELTPKEIRRTGFPLSAQLVRREIVIAQGTVQATYYARRYGIAMNVAGGTHHAFADRGEGFCLLNDIAIGASHLLRHEQARRVLVVDLDVHQGNGTARLFADEPRVFTFSMHGARNYPTRKESSDLDIGLPDGTEDTAYLRTLRDTLPRLLEAFAPDFIFYLSGVDVLATDALGRLSLTLDGCRTRDRYVLETCHREGLPVVVCMGGGYSPRVADVVEAHANTFRLAQQIYF